MGKLLDKLQERSVLIGDGAWGTFLYKKGLDPGECPELWNVERAADVAEIAKSYANAGADIIETNSFGASEIKLDNYGLSQRADEINRAAAKISKSAAPEKIIAGSIGPTGKMLLMGDITEKEMYEAFFNQAKALYEGGADAICIETMMDAAEAGIAVKAAKDAAPVDVICTFAFERTKNGQYRTIMGTPPNEAAKAALLAGADVIGANCGNGMAGMIDIIKELRSAHPKAPIAIQANAGLPVTGENGEVTYPQTPEEMASLAKEAFLAGANILGGCCGTTPAHIRALREAADSYIKNNG